MELEESRNSLLQENLRLTEIISGMQSQIQSLEKSIVSSCALPVGLMVCFLCPSSLPFFGPIILYHGVLVHNWEFRVFSGIDNIHVRRGRLYFCHPAHFHVFSQSSPMLPPVGLGPCLRSNVVYHALGSPFRIVV